MNTFWIILTGCLVAIPCSLLGSYLVLRKMVMIGDAISHAVLPGIILSFMITPSFDSPLVILGAGVMGVLTTFLIEFFSQKGKLPEDASIGVTFTWLFSIGLILSSAFTSKTDIDLDCILFGEILNIPLQLWITESGVNLGPSPVWFLGFVNLIIVSFIILAYKELFITTFDKAFAIAIGISAGLWHYLLMGMVSFVTVASFESVGAVLVISFLVTPASTAYLLTHDLKKMLLLSVLFGIASAVGGYYLSNYLDSSTSAGMVTMGGILFAIVFVISKKLKTA
ncbi:MAG: metal ABC transporter permease [Cytophagales bacterium]|nr:metal ABC transporter permease [Cytophagales bacterium]